MRSARIVLDETTPIERSWCWRDDWATGFDSAYGLLSKFGKLNAMGARELAELFIDRGCGKVTAILRAPNVDLRSGQLFNLPEIARQLRLDLPVVRNAFILERIINGRRKSSDMLRWCPRCAHSGFHTPVFQLELLTACPAHGQALRSACPQCRRRIPYKLQPDVFGSPFCCPYCSADLAPALRDPKTKSLLMREAETAWIANLIDLFVFEDEMVPVKLELNRQRKTLGIGEAVFAPGDWRRLTSEYTGFVTQVLDDLRMEAGGTQRDFNFSRIWLTCKQPPFQAKKPRPERAGRLRRAKAPVDIDRSNLLKEGWDLRLQRAYLVYSAVRRHLWRHVVHDHQRCIAAAARHLWWHMEGERTTAFCPVAEAFLRWRMYWEACGTPCYLFAPMRKDPFGLAAWLASGAPVCPQGWAWEPEQWVSDHVLGQNCLASFRDLLDIAIADRKKNRIHWNSHAQTGRYCAYWAVAGRDTRSSPVRIYLQSPPLEWNDIHRVDQTHLDWHRVALESIRR